MSTTCNCFIQSTDKKILDCFNNGQWWLKSLFDEFIPSEKDCPEDLRWHEDSMCVQSEEYPYLDWSGWMFHNLGFVNAYDFLVKDNTVWFDLKNGSAYPEGMLNLLDKKFPKSFFTIGCWYIDGDCLVVYAHDPKGYHIVEQFVPECNDYVAENSWYDWKQNGWDGRGIASKHLNSLNDTSLGEFYK